MINTMWALIVKMDTATWVILAIVFSPYLIAFVCGLSNGSFMKLRNLKSYTISSGVVHFIAKQYWVSIIQNSTIYLFLMSWISVKSYILIADSRSLDMYIALFVLIPIAYLFFVSFIFCEMFIVGDSVYVYSMCTLFMVRRIPISSITSYSSGGSATNSWLSFTVGGRRSFFWGVSNDQEYVSVMDKLMGVEGE